MFYHWMSSEKLVSNVKLVFLSIFTLSYSFQQLFLGIHSVADYNSTLMGVVVVVVVVVVVCPPFLKSFMMGFLLNALSKKVEIWYGALV